MAEKQMEMQLDEVADKKKEREKQELALAQANITTINPYGSKEAFNELYTKAQYLAKSDLVPDSYRNKPANCMIALETSNRLGVSPLFVMEQLTIVRGKRSWSGQACSLLVNNYPKFKDVRLVYVGKEGQEDWGAYVEATRKDTNEKVKGTTITMKMVKTEGWDSNVKWRSMPEQMLAYRAYSFFARVHCADVLNGFMTEGEPEDAYGEPKEAPSFE